MRRRRLCPCAMGSGVCRRMASQWRMCSFRLGEVGHENIVSASRMNQAVVVFLKEQHFVNQLIENGLVINDNFVQVTPLQAPTAKITVSNVPPFIPDDALERELVRFGKFASGFKTITRL